MARPHQVRRRRRGPVRPARAGVRQSSDRDPALGGAARAAQRELGRRLRRAQAGRVRPRLLGRWRPAFLLDTVVDPALPAARDRPPAGQALVAEVTAAGLRSGCTSTTSPTWTLLPRLRLPPDRRRADRLCRVLRAVASAGCPACSRRPRSRGPRRLRGPARLSSSPPSTTAPRTPATCPGWSTPAAGGSSSRRPARTGRLPAGRLSALPRPRRPGRACCAMPSALARSVTHPALARLLNVIESPAGRCWCTPAARASWSVSLELTPRRPRLGVPAARPPAGGAAARLFDDLIDLHVRPRRGRLGGRRSLRRLPDRRLRHRAADGVDLDTYRRGPSTNDHGPHVRLDPVHGARGVRARARRSTSAPRCSPSAGWPGTSAPGSSERLARTSAGTALCWPTWSRRRRRAAVAQRAGRPPSPRLADAWRPDCVQLRSGLTRPAWIVGAIAFGRPSAATGLSRPADGAARERAASRGPSARRLVGLAGRARRCAASGAALGGPV